jgi:hypothetical protein
MRAARDFYVLLRFLSVTCFFPQQLGRVSAHGHAPPESSPGLPSANAAKRFSLKPFPCRPK